MVMKNIWVTCDSSEVFSVVSYGTENVSKEAHWGRGSRNVTIIHYVLSGEGYYNNEKIKEGEGFFTPKGMMHEYHSSKEKPWKYFWVILDGEDAEKICRKLIAIDQRGIFSYPFKEELNQFMNKLFAGEEKISAVKAMGIFLLLMSYHEKKEPVCGNKYVAEAKRYLEHNFHRNITIREVAETLYISDRYLYNLFIQYEGISPKQYLNDLRLKKACTMLRNRKYQIKEIAASVGFQDVLTFSRFFSKHMAISPTAYRNRD